MSLYTNSAIAWLSEEFDVKVTGGKYSLTSPSDGEVYGSVNYDSAEEIFNKIEKCKNTFEWWRTVPAPKRGELVRVFGEYLRQYKQNLSELVMLECGKTLEESKGEVQEMIDICDFAVGLSRQLYGLTIASERPQHVMHENWHPLGVVGVISAFNFPVAVWAWNATLALVCGNTVIWKPSEKTPLTAIACNAILSRAFFKCFPLNNRGMPGSDPKSISEVVQGNESHAEILVNSYNVKLISTTGSCAMGKEVGPAVAKRFGKCLLELGGNNAAIITDKADLDIAIPSVVFGAVGTTGQRCTTTRRLIVHQDIYDDVIRELKDMYSKLSDSIGYPRKNKIGPLISKDSFLDMQEQLDVVRKFGTVHYGQRVLEEKYPNAYYVYPAIVELKEQHQSVKREVFAPILYVMPYKTLEEALQIHNDVPQGLSSAIFTKWIWEAEYFKQNSDCGIANVNIGTSGAEIGGAFGGEKETGGGRESGSDSWKNYMRRQTSTTYYGLYPPELAQGVEF